MAPDKEDTTRKKKESIVDLSRFIEKKIRVKFQGGREASGILKGYDALINLVLDNAVEYIRDSDDPQKITEVLPNVIIAFNNHVSTFMRKFCHLKDMRQETRPLGLIVARGTAITVVAPNDGIEQIPNPFV